ncbi:hypothetical protein LshimejAT787_0106000 [Lyophyllum shimeji]|uniref:Uncharacterized protein n=1 Tax=Lyophyllum shimeji TaxID=47721 RepID=A0A9P3UJT6_LYOSH|nr:hypothetical protein LshimejAT787_0106000 [Lyophyllum shimeji]
MEDSFVTHVKIPLDEMGYRTSHARDDSFLPGSYADVVKQAMSTRRLLDMRPEVCAANYVVLFSTPSSC